MDREKRKPLTGLSDDGYPIEISTDERIEEFLTEDKLTAEQNKGLEAKLRQPRQKPP